MKNACKPNYSFDSIQSKTMKEVWQRRAAVNIIDGHKDYLQDLTRIASPTFRPTTQGTTLESPVCRDMHGVLRFCGLDVVEHVVMYSVPSELQASPVKGRRLGWKRSGGGLSETSTHHRTHRTHPTHRTRDTTDQWRDHVWRLV